MKNQHLTYALLIGILAAMAALVVLVRSTLQIDSLIGYGAILALAATAAVEYRINWKRLFSR